MPAVAYRIFFDNKPATREQLDRVEEITVEQEVDMAWEAHLHIPLTVDEKGRWTGVDEPFIDDFNRVRIEIKVGDKDFMPLIDGPVVGDEKQMYAEPGQSLLKIHVQDDSVYLNREESIVSFENRLDHEIAQEIFKKFEQIARTEIEKTPSPTGKLPSTVMQRGTAIQLLRSLARRQGMHAYVLPGVEPGQSVGCFKPFPTQTDGLPPLILLGSDRNMEMFTPGNDAQRPARVRAYAVSITDKTITERTSEFDNLDLLGQAQAFQQQSNTAIQILCPQYGDAVDLDQAVAAEALHSSYAFEATGSVLGDLYPGVLAPYRVVTVSGVNPRLSGDYLISHVTHTLTRSYYAQSFTLRRNARSQGTDDSLATLMRLIF
jgi:phage protein D